MGTRGGKGHIEGCLVGRIVGLEGPRTTRAFLQRPGHARFELIRLLSPAYEGRLPVRAGGTHRYPPISAFAIDDINAVAAGLPARGAEFVGELERYHDSYRLCDVRGPL